MPSTHTSHQQRKTEHPPYPIPVDRPFIRRPNARIKPTISALTTPTVQPARVPSRSPTPVTMYFGEGTKEDPIEYIGQPTTPPPMPTTPPVKTEEEIPTIPQTDPTPPPSVPLTMNQQILLPPYFASKPTQQPTAATLMALAHIVSTLTVEYRSVTLDQIMWLASVHYTDMQDPGKDDEAVDSQMRINWTELQRERIHRDDES